MVPTIQALWEGALALSIIPATVVAYWDFIEHTSHAAKEVEQHHAVRREEVPASTRYQHNPIKTHVVDGPGPLV